MIGRPSAKKLVKVCFFCLLALTTSMQLKKGESVTIGPTTDTFYSSTSDGRVGYSYGDSWSAVRNAATGNYLYASESYAQYIACGTYIGPGYGYKVFRSFFYLDTSALPDNAVISSATFSIYGDNYLGDGSVSVMKGTQADPLTTADYDSFSGSEYAYVAIWTDAAYANFALNAQGLADINLTGVTKYCARQRGKDYLNVEPTDPDSDFANCYYADNPGTSADPKLVVTYTANTAPANLPPDLSDPMLIVAVVLCVGVVVIAAMYAVTKPKKTRRR